MNEIEFVHWLTSLPRPLTPILVATKLDKLGKAERHPALVAIRGMLPTPRPPIGFSAETGEGKEQLLKVLADLCSPR